MPPFAKRQEAERLGNRVSWWQKACIDQSDIDANLAALPLFLSGCKRLVVLAGVTYPTRLWCVMELFTFVRMGHSQERIYFKQLGGEETELALARFDAAKARCFYNRDREKLLAVVESGFGDLPPFNRAVRDLLGVTLSNLRKKQSTSKILAFSLRERSKKKAKGPAGELEVEPAEDSSQI